MTTKRDRWNDDHSIPTENYTEAIESIINFDHSSWVSRDPCLLLPHIYLGSIENAENLKSLRNCGITHVLNCAGYDGKRSYLGSPYEGLDIDYKEIKAKDAESYDISQHFTEAFRYINKVKRKKGCVLVHCAQGINRSVAICVAYLMVEKGSTLLKAVQLVQRRRGAVLGNRGFQVQLVDFARKHGYLDSRTELEKILPPKQKLKNGYMDPFNVFEDDVKSKNEGKNSFLDKFDIDTSNRVRNGYIKSNAGTEGSENDELVKPGNSIFEDYFRKMKISSPNC